MKMAKQFDANIERRVFDTGQIEIRKAGESDGNITICGYAAVFDMLSEPLGGWREQIAAGAFNDCLGDDVRALFNHDASAVLGRTVSKTLRIAQDSRGLKYEVDLPDTQAARDLVTSIERGDVSQSSFAFRVAPNGDRWDENDDGVYIRTITKVARLYDVSPVTYPAYPDASVGLRSLDNWKASHAPTPDADTIKRQSDARKRELTLLEMG